MPKHKYAAICRMLSQGMDIYTISRIMNTPNDKIKAIETKLKKKKRGVIIRMLQKASESLYNRF